MTLQKMLSDYRDQWIRLVDRVFDQGYIVLNEDEKTWFNVQSLMGAISNGGFISYYYNSGADTADDCLEALDRIGALEIAQLMRRMNDLFANNVPKGVEERNEVISSWPDSVDAMLDEIDERYFAQQPDLERMLVAFIESKGLAGA